MPQVRIKKRLAVRSCGCVLVLPLALIAPQRAAAAGSVPDPGTRVFSDTFHRPDWGRPGAVWCPYTSAYPDGQTNPDDWKLDKITPAAMSVTRNGLHFRATPLTKSPGGPWSTGLITTEPWDGGPCGGDGFTVQAGDYVQVHLRLPNRADGGGHGAWPGVWTWMNGDNEVDVLEWHSEAPDTAEFVNHVGTGTDARVRSKLLGYGKWVYVGARFGTDTVTWYLGSSPTTMQAVYSDGAGVPADWQAYLTVNLSVSTQFGRAPTARTPITMDVSSLQVFRQEYFRVLTPPLGGSR